MVVIKPRTTILSGKLGSNWIRNAITVRTTIIFSYSFIYFEGLISFVLNNSSKLLENNLKNEESLKTPLQSQNITNLLVKKKSFPSFPSSIPLCFTIFAIMKNFVNKIVWITGASSGIGKELAIQIANEGGKIVLSARNEKALNELKNTLPHSEQHMVLPLDLADNKHFDELAKQVIEKYNRIDFLFNSGGVSQRAEACKTDIEVDRMIMEVKNQRNMLFFQRTLTLGMVEQEQQIMVLELF